MAVPREKKNHSVSDGQGHLTLPCLDKQVLEKEAREYIFQVEETVY